MVTFKEYYQGDKTMAALASPNNGKSPTRGDRKHQNLLKKDFIHKCPHVSHIVNGNVYQIKLAGQPLMNTLAMYEVDYAPGQTKCLGNSGVEVKMFEDEEVNMCGMLTKREQNG